MSQDQHYLERELYGLIQDDRAIFDFLQLGSLDGIWYWDLETQENEWLSPRFWELLGFDPEEKRHLASEWQDLIFAEDLETATDNFVKHCDDPSHPYDQVVRYRHKEGSTVWVRCRGMVIRDEAGNPFRMLGAHTDLTRQKSAELMLEKRTFELEAANEKLQEALKSIQFLERFLKVCSYCRKMSSEDGTWQSIESFISTRTETDVSHGICPECAKEHHGFVRDTALA